MNEVITLVFYGIMGLSEMWKVNMAGTCKAWQISLFCTHFFQRQCTWETSKRPLANLKQSPIPLVIVIHSFTHLIIFREDLIQDQTLQLERWTKHAKILPFWTLEFNHLLLRPAFPSLLWLAEHRVLDVHVLLFRNKSPFLVSPYEIRQQLGPQSKGSCWVCENMRPHCSTWIRPMARPGPASHQQTRGQLSLGVVVTKAVLPECLHWDNETLRSQRTTS